MSKRTRIIIGLGTALAVILIALFIFLRYQVRKSFPVTTGTLSIPGLAQPVEIMRDGFGVPLIVAASEQDLFLAQGFVHAQDRLWQMDMSRRIGEGRLSELFGEKTLPFDRMFRIIGLRRIVDRLEQELTEESRMRLQWYADGVNAFIRMNAGTYPVEFDLLRYDPEPWQPAHSILVGRLMAWELNLSWWTDLTLGAIVERVGLDKALDIFPPYPGDTPPAFPPGSWQKHAGAGSDFLRVAQEFRELRGGPGVSGGSNAWVIGPSRSASGRVILANDTHLQLHTPSTWYEMHLNAPGFRVSGMSVPGSPAIVAGSNDSIAWGVTNLMADDADFYIEHLHETDSTSYLYDGQWLPLTIREEEIQVRGVGSVPVVIRSTHHGPLVSDIRTPLTRAAHPYAASMRWTGRESGDQIDVFYRINRSHDWNAFRASVSRFIGPGQNFVYGDIRGNIGHLCGVLLPKRGRQTSTLPLPGWDPAVEWKGFVPFEQLPSLYNPPEGFIASANNKVAEDAYPFHVSDLWEPPARIRRIREVLAGGAGLSVADCERLQNDQFSYHAKELSPYILAALREGKPGIPERALVEEYFENWNFLFSKEDIATAIFQQFYVRLLENIFRDELGDDLFHDFLILGNVSTRVTSRLLEEGMSRWFDDVRTEEVEGRDEIVRRSLRQAVDALRERLGSETKQWRWGHLHTVTLQHPFGLQKPLDRVFNIGPFGYGGGHSVVMSGEYSLNTPFETTVGASFRRIVDFRDPYEIRSVLPTGQSGQVFHRHYDDQTHLWLNGAYRTMRWDGSARAGGRVQRLILTPGS